MSVNRSVNGLVCLGLALLLGCADSNRGKNPRRDIDSSTVEAVTDSLEKSVVKDLVEDTAVNKAARFYAGIECDSSSLTKEQLGMWRSYSKKIGELIKISSSTLRKADTLMARDMTDLRDSCDFVFYPFSGPDFLYPITLFPDADYYFLAGLEPTGTIDTTMNAEANYFRKYTSSLNVYLQCSFFRTLSMHNDFDSEEIDGILPVISMLMAHSDCKIISSRFLDISEDGTLVDTVGGKKPFLAEIKFFQPRSPHHEQTLYYMSANLHDRSYKESFSAFLDNTLPNHHVVTYLKAASYLMHKPYFSKVRDAILAHSMAVLEDDSGIPYRYLKDWNVSLYGTYMKPLKLFGKYVYQTDLMERYETDSVRPLKFRIGYNNPSNWLCARKINK
ncbi:MAG: hypothetical protein J6T67_09910 [Paludibacteraceae bacterium]|nr:hypothetical protein [Paludibacteraceae bacterium]